LLTKKVSADSRSKTSQLPPSSFPSFPLKKLRAQVVAVQQAMQRSFFHDQPRTPGLGLL
jgi:hypothetical protein